MHYKNGREAKENDFVITKQYDKVIAGKLSQLNSVCNACNGMITYPVLGGYSCLTVTVADCYHAEDAWGAICFGSDKPAALCTAAPSTCEIKTTPCSPS